MPGPYSSPTIRNGEMTPTLNAHSVSSAALHASAPVVESSPPGSPFTGPRTSLLLFPPPPPPKRTSLNSSS
ncbi:hypothetical protein K469DRAFT_807203 [Zopfia rhizophila CBS 207.26]|uniref:Uncharacterized protein n=1 Tax=Zopfia rhizophila CBS 207.26 TaxID=1314779 RepID=A0A6A6DGL5_9PEZI|nr:hypothetical protein K469DRAFT_807203 [Zopfia rhizophila CBS 207.26]